jgi:hypothetical protein
MNGTLKFNLGQISENQPFDWLKMLQMSLACLNAGSENTPN